MESKKMTTIEKFKDLKFKNEYQDRGDLEQDMISVLETIKQGAIYAQVASVSASGMSRRIKFYRINTFKDSESKNGVKCDIENITAIIGWLRGYMPIGQWKQGAKYVNDFGLLVGGCGMDMILHTLYSCMVYDEAKEWNQHYRTL